MPAGHFAILFGFGVLHAPFSADDETILVAVIVAVVVGVVKTIVVDGSIAYFVVE
jgi:hypothetical protein